jgi:hypothetical protein
MDLTERILCGHLAEVNAVTIADAGKIEFSISASGELAKGKIMHAWLCYSFRIISEKMRSILYALYLKTLSQNSILVKDVSYLLHSGPPAMLSLWNPVSEVIQSCVFSLSAGEASLKMPLVLSNVYNRAPEQSEQLETLTYQSADSDGWRSLVYSGASSDNAGLRLAFGWQSWRSWT